MDIDTIKRSEAQMLESRDYISSIVETLREAVVVLDSELRVKSANQSFYRMANVKAGEVGGKTLIELDGGLWNDPALNIQLKRLISENVSFEDFELNFERDTNVTESYIINARLIQRESGEGGRLILLAIDDISARRRAETIAAARERLAIVGEIAAGVAHEFRNPLHGVLNCVKILRDQTTDSGLLKWLDLQEEGLRRMDNISSRMLRLAREESGTKTPTDIESLVNGALAMVKPRTHREHIQLDCEIESNLPKVLLDAERVTEALLNLLTNAIDACSNNSKIVLKASKWRMKCGEMLCLSVTDNGLGIPMEMTKSVFEPFFTTKPIGKGSGLGLAIVKRIAESHSGSVELISEPAKGTTVRMFLPLAD
jgi:two-component system CheB/CheR fusion protein